MDVSKFATNQLSLLEDELQAEQAENRLLLSSYPPLVLQRAGLALLNLNVISYRTGLGGKTLLELGLDPATNAAGQGLPSHGLRVGDICSVAQQPRGGERKTERAVIEKGAAQGVITKAQRESITVALSREEEHADSMQVCEGRLWLVKLANDVTHKRLTYTMSRLQKMESAEYGVLSNVLLGRTHPTPASIDDLASGIQWYDPNLNDGQKEAIRFALASREVALIHGPPGTGKTHTLVELIRQLIARDQRLLVCGPSNISVDNIVERLSPHKVSMVRLGHPARLLPTVLNHSLDVLSKTSDAAAIVSGIRAEMDAKQSSIRKTRNGKERRAIYGEMRELRKELRQRESRVVGDLLRSSKVALSTLHGAGSFHLKNERFDVIIVDEASQALEAQCWIPIIASGAPKLVLAGDHLQLPPTIKSLSLNRKTSRLKNKMGTLETTLFDRLLSLYGNTIKCMLTMQYRMHQQIMAFPSAALYEDRLVAAASVKDRLLNGLPYAVQDSEDTKEPLVFWDTQGGDFPEQAESDSDELTKGQLLAESKVNEQEAALARLQVANLIGAGVRAEDIAVVTPYNGQLGLLSSMLKERYPGIELGSVDGFQGREKEAVIVSLVRSNSEGEVGFLGEKRRLNVAMTRPRRHLCVIGDSETVSRGSSFLKAWIGFLEEHADLRYPNLADLGQPDT